MTQFRTPETSSSYAGELAGLRQQFAAFRRKSPKQGRIPSELRAAALRAIAAGVPAAAVCRSCAVSNAQLRRWRELDEPERAESGEEMREARVLAVVPEAPGAEADAVELEIRVGAWRLTLCRAG